MTATAWFQNTMDELRAMPSPTRSDLEAAAYRYFAGLKADLDRPRHFDPEHYDDHVGEAVDNSRSRIRGLEDQLRENVFDRPVQIAAARLASIIGQDIATFTERQTIVAGQLAARAEREQHKRLVHQLLHPAEPFSGDPLFNAPAEMPRPSTHHPRAEGQPIPPKDSPSLKRLTEDYLRRKELSGVGRSQTTELARAFGWLRETFGDDRLVGEVTKDDLRKFRDQIARLDKTLRGRDAPFKDRQTNKLENQIKSVTAKRYWSSVQALYAWAVDEGYLNVSPAAGLRMDPRKHEVRRSPPPFTPDEVRKLFATPLFAGSKSPKRLLEVGENRLRLGHWWSGVLSLFTGTRAGELSQLEPSNFDFNADVPFVRVTNLDADGKPTKTTKSVSSVRDIPLHPVLLDLGLRQFVQSRAKLHPGKRVFFDFRLGSNGRTSEGMTQFWGRYLRHVGLWEAGRSTHMFRHTVADRLRANGVSDEDIGAILGHSGRTETAGYGTAQPLSRKAGTVAKLDYGFDVASVLGGTFDKAVHRP